MKIIGGLCLAGCLLLTSACHREKPRPLSPPPPPPRPVQKSEADIKLDAPPKVEPKTAATEVLPLPAEVQDLPPPPPEPKPQRRRRSTTPAKTTPTPEEEAETAESENHAEPAVELPKLGEVLSADQQKEYRRTIDDSVKRARRNLAIVRRHALSEDQTNTVGQVESLILQADKTQDSDLTSAKSLAERADLLAQDLAKGFK